MKLINRVKSATNAFIRGDSLRAPIGFTPKLRSDVGERVGEEAVMGLSAVWACTNLLSGTISSLPLMVYRVKDGERDIAKDHPLYRILHSSPNYEQTALDFWDFMSRSIDLWGNGYAEIVREGEAIVGLSPINPESVKVSRLDGGEIQYKWKQGDAERVEVDGAILHIRGLGGASLGGMSVLHFGRNIFGASRAVENASSGLFVNGMTPGGVMTFQEFLSEENRAIANGKLAEQFVGASNSGRPLILEGGTTWTPLSINPDDAQMLETRKFAVEDICRFFAVPPHMIGHTENNTSWGTGIEQQTIGFQKFSLRPRLKRIEQALEKQLLTAADRADGVVIEFNIDGLLRGDSAARADFYKAGLDGGWLNINEIRKLENLKPVEGGDINRTQMQNVSIARPENAEDE